MKGANPKIERIADALVLCMTRGMSLSAWNESGVLDREWALYERLRAGYGRIVVGTYGDDDRLATRLGVTCVRLNAATAAVAGKSVADHLRSHGATSAVVKTNQFEGGAAALGITAALRACGLRAGLVARGGYPWSRFQAWKFGPDSAQAGASSLEEAELCRGADIVIGTTRTMVDDLAWRYGLSGSVCRVIPNYVLAEALDGARGTDRGAAILAAGRLEDQKRFALLIRAVAASGRKGSVVLRICGSGPREADLRALAAHEGVRLELPGRLAHRDLLNQMLACDLFVQCSAFEGHPKTVLEAMACGACVLVTDTPGLGGAVEHLRNGYKVGDDAEALSAAIGILLGDPPLRSALGERARKDASDRFSLDRVAAIELAAHSEALRAGGDRLGADWAGVRLLVFDFDGVMSNNQVLVMQDGTEGVLCNRSDGMGVEMLRRAAPEGFSMLVLSKEINPVVAARCRKLKLECHQGVDDKLPHLKRLAAERGVASQAVAYVGNDLNDVACMGWVGLPIAVADAYPPCKAAARHVTLAPGGFGAVREVCDRLIAALGDARG